MFGLSLKFRQEDAFLPIEGLNLAYLTRRGSDCEISDSENVTTPALQTDEMNLEYPFVFQTILK